MSALSVILDSLCEKSITAALIITLDGMIIESSQIEKDSAESLSAFMSQITVTIRNSLKNLGHSEFTRYIIRTNQHRVYLVDLGKSTLVAVAEQDVSVDEVNVALFQAATQIKKTGRLDV